MNDTPREDPQTPHPDRLSPLAHGYAEIMAAHREAVACGQSGYLDPFTGLFVMTAGFHLKRAHCCHNGCRHCPYIGAAREDD